jgi:hypothetical protein
MSTTEPAATAPARTLTAEQIERRRQMAATVCTRAQNETAKCLARKLCKSWFDDCDCETKQ